MFIHSDDLATTLLLVENRMSVRDPNQISLEFFLRKLNFLTTGAYENHGFTDYVCDRGEKSSNNWVKDR